MHSILKTLTPFIFCFMSISILSAQTVWDDPEKKSVKQTYGDLKVYLRATQNAGQFRMSLYNEVNRTMIDYTGQCTRVMGLNVPLSKHIMKDIEFKTAAYETDKSVKNLRVQKYLDAARKAIQSQCPTVEIIYLQFLGGGTFQKATIAKAHDWVLEEGIIDRKELLKEYDVNIDFFDTNVSYYGTTLASDCTKEAEVTLKRSYKMPPWKKGSNPNPSVLNLLKVADRVVREYKAQCSKIETIKFNLFETNEEYLCEEGANCYLQARAKDNWEIKMIGYERNLALTENALIKSYADVMKYLKAGDFKTLKQYPFMTEQFYETFLVEYSKRYAKHIPNPRGRDIVQVSERYENGFKVSDNTTHAVTVYIEGKYVKAFDRVLISNQVAVKGMMFRKVIDARNRQSMSPVLGYIVDMLNDETTISTYLKNKSHTSEEVKTIYDNLYALMH